MSAQSSTQNLSNANLENIQNALSRLTESNNWGQIQSELQEQVRYANMLFQNQEVQQTCRQVINRSSGGTQQASAGAGSTGGQSTTGSGTGSTQHGATSQSSRTPTG